MPDPRPLEMMRWLYEGGWQRAFSRADADRVHGPRRLSPRALLSGAEGSDRACERRVKRIAPACVPRDWSRWTDGGSLARRRDRDGVASTTPSPKRDSPEPIHDALDELVQFVVIGEHLVNQGTVEDVSDSLRLGFLRL